MNLEEYHIKLNKFINLCDLVITGTIIHTICLYCCNANNDNAKQCVGTKMKVVKTCHTHNMVNMKDLDADDCQYSEKLRRSVNEDFTFHVFVLQ